jgi:hypothetical protein
MNCKKQKPQTLWAAARWRFVSLDAESEMHTTPPGRWLIPVAKSRGGEVYLHRIEEYRTGGLLARPIRGYALGRMRKFAIAVVVMSLCIWVGVVGLAVTALATHTHFNGKGGFVLMLGLFGVWQTLRLVPKIPGRASSAPASGTKGSPARS